MSKPNDLVQGALYPALHRLEQQGWLQADWAESETGHHAKFYSLTAAASSTICCGRLHGISFPIDSSGIRFFAASLPDQSAI
jgi:hypothetical protein